MSETSGVYIKQYYIGIPKYNKPDRPLQYTQQQQLVPTYDVKLYFDYNIQYNDDLIYSNTLDIRRIRLYCCSTYIQNG